MSSKKTGKNSSDVANDLTLPKADPALSQSSLTYPSPPLTEKQLAAIAAGSPLGKVGGEKILYPNIYLDDEIFELDADALRSALEDIQKKYVLLYHKVWQLVGYVSLDIATRDPFLMFGVICGVNAGKTDAEMAIEFGEKKKTIETLRLAYVNKIPALKKKRGRPPKASTTPKAT